MNFSKPCVDCNSGRATPFLRRNPRTATRNEPNPAECHLSFAGNCSDNRSQLSTPWHQDQPYYCVDGADTVSLWIPLDVVPRERTLEFVGGSHSWGK